MAALVSGTEHYGETTVEAFNQRERAGRGGASMSTQRIIRAYMTA